MLNLFTTVALVFIPILAAGVSQVQGKEQMVMINGASMTTLQLTEIDAMLKDAMGN